MYINNNGSVLTNSTTDLNSTIFNNTSKDNKRISIKQDNINVNEEDSFQLSDSLKKGNSGKEVSDLQYALKKVGYYKSSVDGYFGENTEKAVSKLQNDNNLKDTGVADFATKKTVALLAASSDTLLQRGSKGSAVVDLQNKLIKLGYDCGGYGADGDFGQGTYNSVIAFQKAKGLDADGIVGPQTMNAINNALNSNSSLLQLGSKGSAVVDLQNRLIKLGYDCGGYGADGDFGQGTYNSVIAFQRAKGLNVDGIVGPETMNAINNELNKNAIPDITNKLNGLMLRYEYMYSDMKNAGAIEKLATFYELVRNKSKLDLKNQGWTSNQYIYNGEVIDNDVPGNIMYGYLGKAFGISDELLLRAAGYAQQKAGTSKSEWGNPWGKPPYGDDPRDQARIKQGIQIYSNWHKK